MVTSARQRQANQRNALQSTGPRTADGKRRASRNATKHGLLARDLLLDDEDAARAPSADGWAAKRSPPGRGAGGRPRRPDRVPRSGVWVAVAGLRRGSLRSKSTKSWRRERGRRWGGMRRIFSKRRWHPWTYTSSTREAHRTARRAGRSGGSRAGFRGHGACCRISRGYASGRRDLKAVALRSRDRAGALPRAPCARATAREAKGSRRRCGCSLRWDSDRRRGRLRMKRNPAEALRRGDGSLDSLQGSA